MSAVRINETLVHWRGLLWSATKGARKPTYCAYSRKDIVKGDRTYRPITNGGMRMQRVLASAWADIPQHKGDGQ